MAKCTELVHQGRGVWPCHRLAKDGDTMCGPHRAGAKRSAAARAKADAEYDAARAVEGAANVQAEELTALAGFSVQPHYHYYRGEYSPTTVEVSAADLRALLKGEN